jgi:hypothetical protein
MEKRRLREFTDGLSPGEHLDKSSDAALSRLRSLGGANSIGDGVAVLAT